MKAAANLVSGSATDFYASTLAPVNQRGLPRFRAMDLLLLTALCLEIAALMRIFLAR